jgi:hypothetical protein
LISFSSPWQTIAKDGQQVVHGIKIIPLQKFPHRRIVLEAVEATALHFRCRYDSVGGGKKKVKK